MSAVGRSTIARRPRTNAAPAMAPEAAAVTPSTKAEPLAAREPAENRAPGRRRTGSTAGTRRARRRRAERPGDEVADERDRDDDRPRRDHRDRDRVEELPLVEPVELVDDPAVEERHDGEAAPEHERARPSAKYQAICERASARGRAVQPGDAGQRRRRERDRGRRRESRAAPITSSATTPAQHEDHSDLGSVHAVDDGVAHEEHPEQPVLASVICASL